MAAWLVGGIPVFLGLAVLVSGLFTRMGVVSVFESRTTRRLGENAPAVAGPLGGVFVFAGLAMIASGLALGAWTVNGGQPNPELIAAAVVVPPMLATVVGAMLRVRSLF